MRVAVLCPADPRCVEVSGSVSIRVTAVTNVAPSSATRRSALDSTPIPAPVATTILLVDLSGSDRHLSRLRNRGVVLPDNIGVYLFEDTWNGAQTVLVPMCVLYLAIAIGVGPGVTLCGMGRAKTTFGLNLLQAPLLLVTLSIKIWQAHAVGVAWAIALTEALVLPFLIVKAVRAMREEPVPIGLGDEPIGRPCRGTSH